MPQKQENPEQTGGDSTALRRGLRARHIQLIAIGGTIGVGLFLGSAHALRVAGPALILSYAVVGLVVFFIIRALGELMIYRPVSGSFASYAEEFCGPFAGFVTGWSYWFMWIVVAMAELTAIGIYVGYWFPAVPQWASALCALAVLYGLNLLAVRAFGEVEFWFALIKVVTIVGLILTGTFIITFGVGPLGPTASFTNIWKFGGLFPFGFVAALQTVQIVTFAYAGIEMIGVTAGEAENPAVVLPRATNSIILRIILFYIGSLVVILALVPWNQLVENVSPFVFLFEKMGLPAAAAIINMVVITAAMSSCNSGVFTTGRMLFSLGERGHAPRVFQSLNRRSVPALGIHASAAVMLLGVGLNYLVPKSTFVWLTSITLVGSLWTWVMIMICHLRYRSRVQRNAARAVTYRMPGAPYANWLVLLFLAAVCVMLGTDPDTRVALIVGPVWFALLGMGYAARRRRESASAPHVSGDP
jgi:AAT family amino acid transporter/D-serine/D-alanine/glycine transporter